MASEIVPERLFLGPEVAVAHLVTRLRLRGVSPLVVRCMEAAADRPDYIEAIEGPLDATARTDGASSVGPAKLLHLQMPDDASHDAAPDIAKATAAVGEWLGLSPRSADTPPADHATSDSPRAVVVHCAAGVSRSATIVTALVMSFGTRLCGEALLDPAIAGPLPALAPRAGGAVGLERALNFVTARRHVVSPNEGFLACLMALEAKLGAGGGEDGTTPTFDPAAHKVRTLAGVTGASEATARKALDAAGMDVNRAAEFIFTEVVTNTK